MNPSQRLVMTVLLLGACQSAPTTPQLEQEPTIVAAPVATIDGRLLDWRQFEPLVAEASGGPVLEEVVLEWRAAAECQRRGITITPELIAAEERLVIDALDADAARAQRLLKALQARQGMGPKRWAALLRRNAMLRALVADQITIDEAVLIQARDSISGPRRDLRMIVVPDLVAVEGVKAALAGGTPFAEVAARVSVDPSAERGGLVTGVTRHDAAYPPAFRQTVFALAPNETSDAVMLEERFLIVQLVAERAANPIDPLELERQAVRATRLSQERAAMERQADRFLRDTSLSVFDADVKGSLDRVRAARNGSDR